MKTYGGFLISQIRQVGNRVFERILKEAGIDAFNGAQGRILYVLWEYKELSITEIGRLTSLAKTTLTSMLERMERQGLVLRQIDPQNRRRTIVRITAKAEDLREDFDRVSQQVNQVYYRGFTEQEIRDFENVLRKILSNLECCERESPKTLE